MLLSILRPLITSRNTHLKLPLGGILSDNRSSRFAHFQPDVLKEGKILIYERSQQGTIRIMLGVSIVNFYAWTGILFNHFVYQGHVIQGIDLGGGSDPFIGYVGMAATFAIAYFTRHFAHQAVHSAYVTEDKKRIGFQVHNIIGNAGRILEVKAGNAKFLYPLADSNSRKSRFFSSSFIPIKMEGVNSNLLVESDGFVAEKEYLEILSPNYQQVNLKEDRLKWHLRSKRK